jgi:hypothetical protein
MKRYPSDIYDREFLYKIQDIIEPNIEIFYDCLISAHNYVVSCDGHTEEEINKHLDIYLDKPFGLDHLNGVDYFMKLNASGKLKMRESPVVYYIKVVMPALKEKYGDNFVPRIRYNDLQTEFMPACTADITDI